jgi:hypothetical protein
MGETNGTRGEKNLRPAGGSSVLMESGGEGGPGGWTPRGGRAEEREGERSGPGRGVEQCGGVSSARQWPGRGALPHDSGGRRGRRDAVDAADRWAGARRGPDHQWLGAAR